MHHRLGVYLMSSTNLEPRHVIEDPRWNNLLEHRVLVPWEIAADANQWCQDHIDGVSWCCAWQVPDHQSAEYVFSFDRLEDSVRFQLTCL